MKIFILIIVFNSGGYGDSGKAALTAEFSSDATCQVALLKVTKNLKVISSGCYEK